MLLNTDKSEVIYFDTRQRLHMSELPDDVTFTGGTITPTDKLKILHVTLDSPRSFDQQVLNIVSNCNFHRLALRHIRLSPMPELARAREHDCMLHNWFWD